MKTVDRFSIECVQDQVLKSIDAHMQALERSIEVHRELVKILKCYPQIDMRDSLKLFSKDVSDTRAYMDGVFDATHGPDDFLEDEDKSASAEVPTTDDQS